jgi:hypothetical protein
MEDVIADNVSLSPNLISCAALVWKVQEQVVLYTHANRNGVILINNRNDTHVQQLFEGIDRIEISCPLQTHPHQYRL